LHALDALFRPSSVAIIGASSDANRIGGRPVAFSKRVFKCRIIPVNPILSASAAEFGYDVVIC
jgi:acetate---CoA ligase (ADP-forming)